VIPLYVLIGAAFATGAWFYAISEDDGRTAWATVAYVAVWVILCALWPLFAAYVALGMWVRR